ncbi:MAG: DNA topoisomerase 4 subunit A [Clostridia bacterium]|nr:DNA topoisomerase 4 subunit A [Clostridia bacterium]
MAKKPPEPPVYTPDIIQASLEEVMHQSMMPYAEYVILERAIPRVEDGLKPVQRRILFTMQELGLTPDKPHRKCARIVGDCLGKYHPHGDSSVYDALVRMGQPFNMRGLLVDGHGNFGSIDGDSAAAMRYTEARMAPLAMQMLRDIDKDTVPFRLNFDDTLKEPDLLPARFPNILVNGASGIAVGLATNIPPHNLREVVNACCAQIDDPDISLDELMKLVPAPDFPTGGILMDTPELRQAYETGRGKLTLRARVHIEDGSSGRRLICITEVPYNVNKAQMLEKILRLSEEKKGQLGGIYDIRDESDRTGMRAVIEVRKDADAGKILKTLYKYSDLQVTFGVNMVAVAEGKPLTMGLKTVLGYYIGHQKTVVRRRTEYELAQARARAHILEALIVAVDNLDEVLALIRSSKNGREARTRLMERFGFDEAQAQAILDLRLQRLTGLEIETLRKEYADILKTITTLEGILASEKKLMNVIKKEMREIADTYGDGRRTTIEKGEEEAEEEEEIEEVIPDDAVVCLTRAGLLRRYAPRTFEKLDLPEKEGDFNRFVFRTQTDHSLMFFTDRGNVFVLSVGDLGEITRPKERGVSLSGVLNGLEKGENCVRMLDVSPGEIRGPGEVMFVTAQGMVKRMAMTEFAVRRRTFSVIGLKNDDTLLDVMRCDESDEMLLVTRKGQSIRFDVCEVPVSGRSAAGVRGIRLDGTDRVILGALFDNGAQLIVMTERGYAKKVMGALADSQARGGKGAKCVTLGRDGLTGTYVAACGVVRGLTNMTVVQKSGTLTPISTEDLGAASMSDRGKPVVMALMDDVVTDLIM